VSCSFGALLLLHCLTRAIRMVASRNFPASMQHSTACSVTQLNHHAVLHNYLIMQR
jgi:hypothetical protein